MFKKFKDEYLRSGFFGAEDALVSTSGLVIGLSTSTSNKDFVIAASIIAIFVSALSAATSELISQEAVSLRKGGSKVDALLDSLIMFLAYAGSGIFPLIPIALLNLPYPLAGTFFFALVGFIIIGFLRGELTHTSIKKSIVQVVIIGGVAAILGVIVGFYFKI
jgi:VIT1/CCC1 family predicted Fe2+/Mn2+ transporter